MLFGKYINQYYKRFALFFILGIVALIAVDWLQLYIPELLGEIVGLFSKDYVEETILNEVLSITSKVLFLAIGMFIGRVVWRLTLFYASTKIEADLKLKMYEKAERLSLDFYKTNKVGTIMSWFTTDTETIEEFTGWGTLMIVDGLFLTLMVLIKMFILDWFITLIILIPVTLIVIWGMLVEKFMSKKWLLHQEAFDELYDCSQESFAGIRVIKAFVKENQQLHHFAKIAKKNQNVEVEFTKISVLFDVCIEIIISLIFALLLGIGGYFVYLTVSGNAFTVLGHEVRLDASKLVVFVSYFSSLIWPLIALGQVITMHSKAKTSLGRITRFLDADESIKNDPDSIKLVDIKGNISFKNFSFRYPDETKFDCLKDITLEIKAGEKIGVIGRIGSGKSTLINALTRLYNFENNTLFIDGNDVMKSDITSLRESIAYVPQDNFLFSDSIMENIKFSNEHESDENAKNAAKFGSIDEDIEAFPLKYDTVLGERGVTLSGGQKQRISIARAILKNAPILIFDDSVSAVDVKTEQAILANINKYRENKTTIVIASRISTVESFDKVIVLNEGSLEAFDSPKNLYKISKTYKTMTDLQKLEKAEEF